MRTCRTILAGLLGTLLSTWTYAQDPQSILPPLAEVQAEIVSLQCRQVGDYLSKWADLLRMQEWAVKVYCVDVPPWETAEEVADLRGSSSTSASSKTVSIWVRRDDPDHEHVALHELLHGLINYAIMAQSHTVEENVVLALADVLDAYDDALRGYEPNEKKAQKALKKGAER